MEQSDEERNRQTRAYAEREMAAVIGNQKRGEHDHQAGQRPGGKINTANRENGRLTDRDKHENG